MVWTKGSIAFQGGTPSLVYGNVALKYSEVALQGGSFVKTYGIMTFQYLEHCRCWDYSDRYYITPYFRLIHNTFPSGAAVRSSHSWWWLLLSLLL